MILQAQTLNITTVYVAPQFDIHNAQTISDELGGQVISIDPLAPGYIENLYEVTDKFAIGLNP